MATVVGGGTKRHGQQALTLAVLSCRLLWLRGARVVGQRHPADGISAHRLLRWVPGQLLGVPLGQGRLEGLVVTVLKASWAQQWRIRDSTLPPSTAGWKENWGWDEEGLPEGSLLWAQAPETQDPQSLANMGPSPQFPFFFIERTFV